MSKQFYRKVEVVVYENIDEMCRIEYKGRIIQTYGYNEGDQTGLVHFVLNEDGNDDCEFFCLLEAIRYIDKTS